MTETAAAPAPPPRRGCLRRSCGCALGCLGLVVLAAVAMAILALATKPGAEHRVASQADAAPAASGRGVVRVDMEEGVLVIEAADPGEAPSARADHDEETSELDSQVVPGEGGSWEWRVSQRPLGTLLGRALGGRREEARLVVRLPRDVPHDLVVTFSKGRCTLDLGGLPLRSVDLEASMGECQVAFDEPLPEPLENLSLRVSMGEFRLDRLGNASPARLGIHQRLSELRADFSGAWRTPSATSIDFGFGETWLRIPSDVTVVADRVHVSAGEIAGPPLPAAPPAEVEGAGVAGIRLTVDGRFGELRIERPEPGAPVE